MGFRDDIATLEARLEAGHEVGQHLADLLNNLGRYGELIAAADGVDPANLGAWDCQDVVTSWLKQQG